MSKKNRNWMGQNKEDTSSETEDMDSLDFGSSEFENNDENNLQEPSPVETPAVEQESPKEESPTVVVPKPKPETIEHKEEPMPTTEVKHQEITPSESIPNAEATETNATQSKKPIVVPKNNAVTRFANLARNYITLAQHGLKSDEQKKQAVAILSDIVYLVTTSHDRAVFEACFSFFLANRAIMLSEQTVMGSVTHYADQTKINRIVQFYVVFTSLVETKLLRKRYTININHVRDVFNNRKLAEWLADKR